MNTDEKQRLISESLLSSIESNIQKYKLFSKGESLILAFSGGKDSMFALRALDQLGYDIYPVHINLYDNQDITNLSFSQLYKFRNKVSIINSRSDDALKRLNAKSSKYAINQFSALDSFGEYGCLSPCTPCFNIKILFLLEASKKLGSSVIVFAHHATDAIASFLKSSFMYIDRWYNNNEIYQNKRFQKLIQSNCHNLFHGYQNFIDSHLFFQFSKLAREKNSGTDEPPKQTIGVDNHIATIVRPLFGIFENEIVSGYNNNLQKTFDCEIKQRFDNNYLTPREIVHSLILNELVKKSDFTKILSKLLSLVETGIDNNGELIKNVRYSRDEILGPKYKSTPGLTKLSFIHN